ncbi:MAG: 3-carboxy-cis,cis-muconate cycloisomerase [Hyphomicrobiales bacterium]
MVGAQSSEIYGILLGDPLVSERFSDAAHLRALLDVEAALARAQGKLGIIPADAAAAIDEAAQGLTIAPAGLVGPTCGAGLPVIALVETLRDAVGGEAAQYVHWGATSQDILDTGLVLQLRTVLQSLSGRLDTVIAWLALLARSHRDTIMVGRTRSQQATPITFGLKAVNWLAPLIRHRERLAQLRPRVLVVQLGGAAGTMAAYGDERPELITAFADELSLGAPMAPWHAGRDGFAELASWFSLTTGSLGKVGQDLVLLSQSEVGEVGFDGGGGSSTMPQKQNPVLAETLVTLARHTVGLLGTAHLALVHGHERDGAAWASEWLTLPQMAVATATSLAHAVTIFDMLTVDSARMMANLEASNGAVLAEAASFALSEHMPRAEAYALVKQAAGESANTGVHLIEVLKSKSDAPVDWAAVADPKNWTGAAGALVDRICAEADGDA